MGVTRRRGVEERMMEEEARKEASGVGRRRIWRLSKLAF